MSILLPDLFLICEKYYTLSKYFDSEGAVLSQYDVNGYEAQVVTYHAKSDIYVVWNDGEYVYALSSFALSVDELLEVARSVQAVPNP